MELPEIKPKYPDAQMNDQPQASQIFGNFQTVNVIPTMAPVTWLSQIQIYINGATKRLYVYDTFNGAWHYITFTA